eukprot:g1441.t1
MLDRKARLAKIRKQKKDAEEQRLLDLSLKIAKQKADAQRAQREKLLRQRRKKQAQRDGIELSDDSESQKNVEKSTVSTLVPNPRSTDKSSDHGLPALVEMALAPTVTEKNNEEVQTSALKAKREEEGEERRAEEKKREQEEEERVAARNVYVEANPAGYAFPLLSVFAERDRSMRLERMKNPSMMTSEETLLRTLDKITRNEVNSSGKRVRKNTVAQIRMNRKKRFQKRMYMYDLDHAKPVPKYPSAVGGKLFTEIGKAKKPPANWVDIHGKTKKADVKKAEHFMQLLHEEQVKEAARSHEIAKVQANGDHRRQMKLYNMMKAAQSQDKMIDLMEDAGFLSMPQYIDHCLKSSHLDHVITSTMRQQNI